MSRFPHLSRRQVIRGILATTAFGVTSKFGTGCSSTTGSKADSGTEGTGGKPLVIGFIYVGAKDDYGYNQAHAEGAAGIAKIPGVKIVEQASVPETTEVQEAMRSMIEQDGATVIFPTSFGYFDPHVIKVAQDYPDVQFLHCGGLYVEGKHPKNVGTYFGYIDEAQYVAGIVAGLTSKSSKLGFIAAKPIPQVLRNINSFTLGARSVNPKVTTQVVFTGDWALPVKEAEAANSMADQGIDVLTAHVDSPKVIVETAEKRGIFASGYHANQSALSPKGYLTGAEWDWTTVYTKYAEMLKAGKTTTNGGIPHLVRGGFKEGFLKLSPYSTTVSDKAKKEAEAAKAKFLDGSMVIYKGAIKDNSGKVIIAADKEYKQQDPELEKMNWLVDGVIGKV
ncbi:MAG TPA: BMP family ABC transporter substrate-binding protein [Cyanobacteria bacterium UBA11149]|nr:BMP family ABC transporter substrate-binding protein [Cyanobacteria bacterium UBA11367]HBE55976.1 BMP family ABC transporter substrate-binding protein [Cyanobacteria bacterium UBA11366]HBK63204.1 BMP family ABC transporter substrate-binding protein [Cyanobacteria bacterium UBA11166]HBR74560.1 BMP family ABC transporter substrate-binding protein [Cyanobacteria bacterium UBA11159]HBS67905.1 BMP family ABC transporter substrate-binding protein [Cyanobacteria bacterium UBA11153]HBW91923.1 BMP f